MARLTVAMRSAERQTEVAAKDLSDVETVLEQALAVAGSCQANYRRAPGFVRRQINQGFFEKLLIEQDGSVEGAELTEPFAVLTAERRDRRGGSGGLTAATDTAEGRPGQD